MALDLKVEKVMLKALHNNLGYKDGETLVIVAQRWDRSLDEGARPVLDRSVELCANLERAYSKADVDVSMFTYVPSALGSTVEPTEELHARMLSFEKLKGVPDIVIAPCGYSITHTRWRVDQNKKGSRIATMSNSSLAMFSPRGPFDVEGDYQKVVERTKDIAAKLRESTHVHIAAPGADFTIHVDPNLVHAWTGYISKPGEVDNWLGAEAYVVPVHPDDGGDSHGRFTVPKGWGGREQLKYATRFAMDNGRFVYALSADGSPEAQDWINKHLNPMIFSEPGNAVVAELGFGTNHAVSDKYLMENWSIAVAEKKYGSEKGRTVHVAHGNTKGMGGKNDVPIHQDFLILDVKEIDFS